MKTSKTVLISFGVTLYAILTFALLSHVHWRSACDTCAVEETACQLHSVATGLLLSVVITSFLAPFVTFVWIRYIPVFKQWAYTSLGAFLVSNATVVTAASTIVIIVEQFMCPRDKTVEFAAVVLIFVVQLFTGILVEEVYIRQQKRKFNTVNYQPAQDHTQQFLDQSEEEI